MTIVNDKAFLSYYSQINLKEDCIMKLSNLKTWLPGMIMGLSLLAAVPVSAGNLHSENTPPRNNLSD